MANRTIGSAGAPDISGQLTQADGSVRLKDKINSVLHEGSRNILLNLGDVSYIDSGGLGQVVSSFTSVTRENGSLKLLNVGKRSKNLLAMTKLLTVFDTSTPSTRRSRVSRAEKPDPCKWLPTPRGIWHHTPKEG